MAAMDVQVRIRAIDQFSNTLDKLQRKLKSLDGAKGGLSAGDGPGVTYARRADRLAKSVAHAEQRHAASTQPSGAMAGMPAFGLPAGLIGGAAIGVSLQKTVAAAADFESQMTAVQKKLGATDAEMGAIREKTLDLATSGKLASSIEEIAAAMERGAAAGIPTAELEQFALVSAKAADAFEMSATDTGNSAAGFSKILKIPMAEMENYFDLINSLADSGIADEKDIVQFADAAGSPLKNFGLQNDQIAALGATMANLKVPADVAANAMKSFTSRIMAPDTMDKAGVLWLDRLTGGIPKFQRAIRKNANGALLELLDSINKLDEFSKAEALARIAGGNYNDNIATLADNLDVYRQNLALAADESKWLGSLDKSYELKLGDFWSQWAIAKNALGRLIINLGTMGMPAFKAGLEGAIELINQIDQGLDAFKIDLDWGAINEAKAAVGELITEVGRLIGVEGDTSIRSFFEDLAAGVNDLATKIKAVADELEAIAKFVQDPIGETTRPRTAEEEKDLDEDDFRFITPEYRARLIEEKARQDAGLPTVPVSPKALRSGRVGFTPNPFADGRYIDGSTPQIDQSALEEAMRVRRAAQSAAPIAPATAPAAPSALPDISTVPIPTARPEIDTSAFLQGTSAIETAKAGIATPVMATADMNIAPLLSKVEQAKAAVRSLDAMSATVGAGNGANFNARVRDQF